MVFIKCWGLNLFGHGSHLNFKLLISKWFLISHKPILILFTHHPMLIILKIPENFTTPRSTYETSNFVIKYQLNWITKSSKVFDDIKPNDKPNQ